MNDQTPLIREGLKPLRGKTTFFFKVMVILAVHVIVIGGLLLQGCKETDTKDASLAPPAPDPASVAPDQKPPPVTNTMANQPLPVAEPPSAEATPADITVYTVKPGDTLGKIASLHHISSQKLKMLNDLKTNFLKVGQKLKVPAAKVA
jgi:hypothetical protein